MSTINDGGPAFPVQDAAKWQAHGMSLRDYFAIHADMGDVEELSRAWGEKLLGRANPGISDLVACLQWWAEYRATLRYMEADAMLAAREKGGA